MSSTEDDPPKGMTTVLGHGLDTTGWLGSNGEAADRGFPAWATFPSDQDWKHAWAYAYWNGPRER